MGMRKLRRQIASSRFDIRPREVMVWAYMIYQCEDCGWMTPIYLENTLERHNGNKHKPVPFAIRCRKCVGFHCYDRSLVKKLPEERPLKPKENYFRDDKNSDCGIPVIRKI